VVVDSLVGSKYATGAPGTEIEVTPEMIAVGMEPFDRYDPPSSIAREKVIEIFEVMTAARKA
jgi:hypothetical protein